jgi:hypothetical protein
MGAHSQDSTAGPAGGRLSADLAAHVESIVHAAEREARVAEQAIAEHRRRAEEEVRRYLAAARLQVDAETAGRAARIVTLSTAARRLADELTDAVAALTRELQAGDQHMETRLPRAPWPAEQPPAPSPTAATAAPAAAAAAPPEPIASEPIAPAPPTPEPATPEAVTPEPPAMAPQPSWSRVESAAASTPAIDEPAHDDARNGNTEVSVPSAARLVAIEMAVGGSSRAEVEEHLRGQLGVAEPEPLLDDVFGAASHAGSRLAWGEP